jgi:hypothetical protein
MPSSPSAKDNRIVPISVSTLDARYAAVRLDSKTAGPSVLVLHESVGPWFEEAFGSSPDCDAAPEAVLADLNVGCSPQARPPGSTTAARSSVPRPRSSSRVPTRNYSLAGVAWHRWGKATANGAGKRANDCTPTCAAGHFDSYPVTVAATRLQTCGRARYYAHLTITYPGKRPAGIAKRTCTRSAADARRLRQRALAE